MKVRIYIDNTVEIIPHSFYPTPPKLDYLPKNPYRESTYIESSYMSSRDYSLTIKRIHRKLFSKQLSMDNLYFFTLTLKEKISLKQLNVAFHNFIVYVKRYFGKVEYLRAFEFHNKGDRLHVHVLLSFKDNPANLTKDFIEKYLWKLGNVHFEKSWNITGAIQYLTTYKKNNIQKNQNKGYTYFPKGTKIFSMSKNFILSDKEYKEIEIDKETYYFILSKKAEINKSGGFVREDKHFYYDERTQTTRECMDRVFIRSNNDVISSLLSL